MSELAALYWMLCMGVALAAMGDLAGLGGVALAGVYYWRIVWRRRLFDD